MKRIFSIATAFIMVVTLSSCGYNTMVDRSESVEEAWGKVQSQYQRRSDLIPNLVKTVKGYADFEQETLTKVIEARSKATQTNIDASQLDAAGLKKFQEAQGNLSSALSRLLVTVERYPDLKANQSFLDLQNQLEGTENRISVARNRYNQAVKNYNAYIKKFPRVFYASWFDFEPKPYFESDPGAEKAPEVEF